MGDGMLLSAFHMYEKELARAALWDSHGSSRLCTDYLDSEVNQLIETLRKDNGAKISLPSFEYQIRPSLDGRLFTSIAPHEAYN